MKWEINRKVIIQVNGLIKYILLVFFLLFGSSLSVQAQDAEITIEERQPDKEWLKKQAEGPEFNYTEKPKTMSLFERFIRWLRSFFDVDRDSFADVFLTKYMWYLLFIAVAIFVIIKLFGAELRGVFYKTPVRSLSSSVLQEDINEINFEDEIETAAAKGHYRYAVRLLYLYLLKALNDNEFIKWRIDKTNSEYREELRPTTFFKDFSEITKLYNWVWYGEAGVSESEYNDIRKQFINLNSTIKEQA